MNSKKKYRVAILMSHPIHYLASLYKTLNRDPEMEITAYFCSDFGIKPGLDNTFGKSVKWYDKKILEDIPHKFLKNYSPIKTVGSFFSLINPGIISELKNNHYDAILIHGYNYFTNIIAIWAANIFNVPILFRGESHLLNKRPESILRFKKFLLSFLFGKINFFLATGTLNADYYKFYGVPPEKVSIVPYAADNYELQKLNRDSRKNVLKRKYGLETNSIAILYLAKLIKRKRPSDLIMAYETVKEKTGNDRVIELVFVGDGPEKRKLENYKEKRGLTNVHFFGFKKPEELPEFYALADIFVLPSSFETWGMAINEAMNFGLPVITTTMTGAGYDLVKHGKNGFVYKSGDIDALTEHIKTLAENEPLRKKMGEISLQTINKWSFKEATAGIISALKLAKKPSVVVANPGSHHLWRTAIAFQKADILKFYVTSIYYKPHRLMRHLLNFLPQKIKRELKRRNYEGLNPNKIKTFGFYEWVRIILNRVFKSDKIDFYFIDKRNSNFSLKTGKLASKKNSILWCGLDGAREAFLNAKKNGVKCILDQFIGHPIALNDILKEEIELHPELKGVSKDVLSSEKIERLREEMALADFLAVGSKFAEKTLTENGIPQEKIKIIPYGVDADFLSLERKKTNNAFNILFVGNISVRKGCHYLLEAVKEINSPKIKLTMVGTMEDKYFLREFGDYFDWISQTSHEHLPKFYREADVYIYPSLFEGSSLSIYEAMASGLPVITTENSGSVVQDGKNGFIIPIRDVAALKEKILLLYNNKTLREKMSENARKQAENYTWETYSQKVAELIKHLEP